MNRKMVGILVLTLLIATAVLPVVGTMNEKMDITALNIQQPTIEWEKTLGGDEFDYFRCIQQTSDGGYIAFGEKEQDNMNYAWLLKLDANGNEEWSVVSQNLNGSTYDTVDLANVVIETSDGSYLACGLSEMYFSEYSMWASTGYLWKVDSSGETDWLNRYLDVSEEVEGLVPFNIIELDDGYIASGFAIIVTGLEPLSYTLDGALFKTDVNGNLEWYKKYDGGRDQDVFNSLCITNDGGYFLSGASATFTVSESSFWMLKTDSEGTMQWEQMFSGPGADFSPVRGCGQTDDGGYIMCGMTESYGAGKWDIWLIKTDGSGNKEWDSTFGGSGYDQTWSMQILPEGGYIIGGVYNRMGFGITQDDAWIIKTDTDGNAEWKYQIEESGRQQILFIVQTTDGGYIASGRTGEPDSKSTDAFIMKIGAFENDRPLQPSINGPSNGKPDIEYTFTTSATDPDGDSLSYMWDWGDGNFSEWLDTNEATYTWTYEDNFEVRVMTEDEHGGESDWSDPLSFSTPKNKPYVNTPFLQFLENHLHMFPLLRQLLDL